MGNSPAVIDRFYMGAIGKVEVEKFWNILPNTETPRTEDQPPESARSSARGKGIRGVGSWLRKWKSTDRDYGDRMR
jgi:hypothetical protein